MTSIWKFQKTLLHRIPEDPHSLFSDDKGSDTSVPMIKHAEQ